MRTFSKEELKEPFTTKDFIERITQSLVIAARASKHMRAGGVDQQPFVELLERSIADLTRLEKEVDVQTTFLESATNELEAAHRAKLQALMTTMQATASNFEKLDDRIRGTATKAALVGDQLESLNIRRQRAAQARDMMLLFEKFKGGADDEATDLTEWLHDTAEIHHVANLLQKLNFMASELVDPQFKLAQGRIQDKCNQIEQKLLVLFSEAYAKDDIESMHKTAEALYQFTGYTQCIDLFINQHELFYDISKLEKSEAGKDIFDSIVSVCAAESETIVQVFLNPSTVMQRFLERIYEQRLQDYVDKRLGAAKAISLNEYLQELQKMHRQCHHLRENLSHLELCGDAQLLATLTDNIFALHLPDSIYIKNELLALQQSCTEQLAAYYKSIGHEHRTGGEKNLLHRMVGSFSTQEGLEDKIVSTELGLTLIHDNKEALSRCRQLSPTDRLADSSHRIFLVIIDALGVQHLEYGLDFVLSRLPPIDQRPEPELNGWQVIFRVNYVCHVFQSYFTSSVVPAVSSSFAVQSSCYDKKNDVFMKLQSKTNLILMRSLELMVAWCEKLWQQAHTQADFRPTEEDVHVFSLPHTNACELVCKFVSKHQEALCAALDGRNKDVAVEELAIRFQQTYLAMLTRIQINNTGALLISRDVDTYIDLFKEFGVTNIAKHFQLLKDLCNAYMVSPDNIKQIVTDSSSLSRLSREALVSLLERREDWRSIRATVLPQFGPGASK